MSGSESGETVSPFRVLLLRLSEQISSQELSDMKHLLKDDIGQRRREEALSCLDLWDHLEKAGKLSDGRTDLLKDVLYNLPRRDLVKLVEEYENQRKESQIAVSTCGKTTPPPIQCKANPSPTQCQSSLPPTQCIRQTSESAKPVCFAYTQPPLQEEGKSSHLPTSVQSESQTLYNGLPITAATDGPTDPPETTTDTKHHTVGDNMARHSPRDYRQKAVRIKEQKVLPKAQNYMETAGYRVAIVGGKHYEIDEEEFVEMDHSSSYHIRLTNSHLRSCDAQLSIDGKDVGTWRLEPKQEIELERPEEEQMCFTFFSTRMAPAEAGIRRGVEENGLVQVTFTPEKMREEKTTVKDLYRGGDQGAEDDTASSDSSSGEEDEPFRSDTPLNWSSGATALQGISQQEFEQVEGEIEKDEEAQVIMILRLVARIDGSKVEVSSAPIKPLTSKRPRAIQD
ncbi:PREDICTED: uncharacterized protein LOC109470975 isoform X1 [Branchiostoma belcheri]|uniref:Uncharacterized protein LOC109470975 isoform X1 n=1 Tax=Branchiostoma belcheri TaxID=7741 RepID=A0A6P4YMM2_BRABE|nr:PREDICTED: uncharacterized protein LOC109470975 isoform X1 [Branchiostoma belcheri]